MTTLGEIAYRAYGESREWCTANGGTMPSWSEQRPELRAAWDIAAHSVAGAIAAAAEKLAPSIVPAEVRGEMTVVDRVRMENVMAQLATCEHCRRNQFETITSMRDQLRDIEERLAAQKAATTRAQERQPHLDRVFQAALAVTQAWRVGGHFCEPGSTLYRLHCAIANVESMEVDAEPTPTTDNPTPPVEGEATKGPQV